MPVFIELSIIIVLATIISLLMKMLRQPLLVGYIATGIIIGPYFLNLIHSEVELELFSKIGVAILLFIVGLTLNPDIFKEVGKASAMTGIGQVLFTSLIGFFIIQAMGFDVVSSLYAAIALTFSSTIIILKLLTDRGDTETLYGKIAIGLLLVQDIVATIILLVVTSIGATNIINTQGTWSSVAIEMSQLLVYGTVVFIVLYLLSKYVLPKVFALVANSQEILFVFSIGWGLGLASLFSIMGFSLEIGALIAGVTFAASPFAYEIGSRMRPLRDFFVLIFFILLGSQLVLAQLASIIFPALILSLFVLVGNPLVVFVIMNLLGYRKRTAFMTGLTVAQISEFSLILVGLGFGLGHISQQVVSLVTLVGIITIAGSTYMILYADSIYNFSRGVLGLISFRKKPRKDTSYTSKEISSIIFGYDRVGQDFVDAVKTLNENFMVVDYNPASIKRLQEKNIPHRYGDAEDVEFLQEINYHSAKLIISTVPDTKVNLLLVKFYRKINSEGIIVVIAHHTQAAQDLYKAGASYVVMPHHLGAHHAALLIEKYGFDATGFAHEMNIHTGKLMKREF